MRVADWVCLDCKARYEARWSGFAGMMAGTCPRCGGVSLGSEGSARESGCLEIEEIEEMEWRPRVPRAAGSARRGRDGDSGATGA